MSDTPRIEHCDARMYGIDSGDVVLDVVLGCELESGHEGNHWSGGYGDWGYGAAPVDALEQATEALIERHASLLADAERAESKSRAHNLRTKAAGIGEAIALLKSARGSAPLPEDTK